MKSKKSIIELISKKTLEEKLEQMLLSFSLETLHKEIKVGKTPRLFGSGFLT